MTGVPLPTTLIRRALPLRRYWTCFRENPQRRLSNSQWHAHPKRTPCNRVAIEGLCSIKQSCRGLVKLTGGDSTELLQGLVTNDLMLMSDVNRVMYTIFLNKEGRILFDVLCYRFTQDPAEAGYLLECDVTLQEKLARHLKLYRLRKKADISIVNDEFQTSAVFNPAATHQTTTGAVLPNIGGVSGNEMDVADPRVTGLGRRIILPADQCVTDLVPGVKEVDLEEYTLHRYRWGVPEGVTDLPPGESLPLESNLDLMNGVSFTKGCYLGQELTARTHHTGVVRKRIMPIEIRRSDEKPVNLELGSKIVTQDGKNVGKLRSYHGNRGLALLRIAQCKDKKLFVTETDGAMTELSTTEPSWWLQDQQQHD